MVNLIFHFFFHENYFLNKDKSKLICDLPNFLSRPDYVFEILV